MVLSVYWSRACVEPVVGRTVRVPVRVAAVRVCAPPDEAFAGRLAGVGVPLVPLGQPVRPLVHGPRFRSAADVPRHATKLAAVQFDTVAAVAEECAALVMHGMMQEGVWL
jgi:vancomycin aglycone glucosyltransferase